MSCLVALVLALASAPEPISVYVGPNIRGGFVDIDKGVQDSIADLQQELRGDSALRVVLDEATASVKLYVTARRKFKTGNSVVSGTNTAVSPTTSTGLGYAIAVEGYRVEAILRVGDYERAFMGESETRWKGCTQSIAKDLAIWLKANRERIPSGK